MMSPKRVCHRPMDHAEGGFPMPRISADPGDALVRPPLDKGLPSRRKTSHGVDDLAATVAKASSSPHIAVPGRDA